MQATEQGIEREARRRAGMKLGWFIHAGVYVAVMLLLVAINARTGGSWVIFPALGWGIGLAAHGIVTFLVTGSGVRERLVERERRKLRALQEPW